MKHFLGPVGFLLVSLTAGAAPAADVKALVRTIDAVGPEGAGIAEAARAWRELSRLPAADPIPMTSYAVLCCLRFGRGY